MSHFVSGHILAFVELVFSWINQIERLYVEFLKNPDCVSQQESAAGPVCFCTSQNKVQEWQGRKMSH
jgi:hypothetical protein